LAYDFSTFLLSILSISVGYLTREFFIGFGTNFWGSSIFILPQNYLLVDIEFIDLFYKQLPLILTILGVVLAFFIYTFNLDYYYTIKKTYVFKAINNFLSRKWYFDRIYNQLLTQNTLYYSYYYTYKDVDRGIVETFGPSGIINFINSSHSFLKTFQTGNIFHYLFSFFLSICIILLFIILS